MANKVIWEKGAQMELRWTPDMHHYSQGYNRKLYNIKVAGQEIMSMGLLQSTFYCCSCCTPDCCGAEVHHSCLGVKQTSGQVHMGPTGLVRWTSTCIPTQTSRQFRHHRKLPANFPTIITNTTSHVKDSQSAQKWKAAATGEVSALSHSKKQSHNCSWDIQIASHRKLGPLEWTSSMGCVFPKTQVSGLITSVTQEH